MTARSVAAAALLTFFGQSAALAANVTGSWEYNGPAESGLWLKTRQQGNKVHFQLELQRGSPSYNSGWIEGDFKIRKNFGVFKVESDGKLCEIVFKFYSSRVELSQFSGKYSCNFGYNVFAAGTLQRKSNQTPEFSEGDPRFGK